MIKTVAAWCGLGLTLAILLDALGVPIHTRIGLAVVYALIVGPAVYRQLMAAKAQARRGRP